MSDEFSRLLSTIHSILTEAKYGISISTDISTTKGMEHSFLSVCAHLFDSNFELRSIGVDLIPITGHHTGHRIAEVMSQKLNEFSLTTPQIIRFVTDGASNMKSAFHNPYTGTICRIEEIDEQGEEYDGEEMLHEIGSIHELELDDDDALSFTFDQQLSCAIHILQLCLRDVFERILQWFIFGSECLRL